MPTFTTLDNEMPEIDPDALTVNLTGGGIGPDDLVKKPENVSMPKEHVFPGEVQEFGSPSVETDNSETVEPETSAGKAAGEQAADSDDTIAAPDKDEEEIQAIEKMLKTSRSARQREKKKSSVPAGAPKARRIDPIVVVSCVVAVLLVGVFSAYFLGFFSNKDSLNISVKDYASAYQKTSTYKQIAAYGFNFPDVSYTQGDSATTFSGTVENTNKYAINILGALDTNGKIQSMVVVFRVTSANSYEDIKHILAPYVQVLYPNMTDTEALAYIETLYTSKAGATIKGNYGMSLIRDVQDSYVNLYLYSIPVNDAKTMIKKAADYAATASASVTPAASAAAAS